MRRSAEACEFTYKYGVLIPQNLKVDTSQIPTLIPQLLCFPLPPLPFLPPNFAIACIEHTPLPAQYGALDLHISCLAGPAAARCIRPNTSEHPLPPPWTIRLLNQLNCQLGRRPRRGIAFSDVGSRCLRFRVIPCC